MNTLNIWSDIPGQMFKASTEGDAKSDASDEASEGGVRNLVEEVQSLNDVLRLFRRLLKEGDVWHKVHFNTHGSRGSVNLGSTTLSLDSYKRLDNEGFAGLFDAGCIITFDGCNVADGAVGEYFLVMVGATLLYGQGGKVRANTNVGVGRTNWFGTPHQDWHPFGTWVTANVGVGGTVELENAVNLDVANINKRLESLDRIIAGGKGASSDADWKSLQDATVNARNWMVTDGFKSRFNACLWLDQVENLLRNQLDPSIDFAQGAL